jgi:uncharacterized membrane protein YphA (DoxX/SURF4 family)
MIAIIISALIALAATGSGIGKLTKNPKVMKQLADLGVPPSLTPIAGILELLGAAGIVIGWAVKPLAVVAAAALAAYFACAAYAHVRAKDTKGMGPAVVLCILAIVAAVLLAGR